MTGKYYTLIISFLLSFSAAADWHRQEAAIMGTAVTVELWYEDAVQGRALVQSVMDEMHRIDQLMSTYKSDSELSVINKHAASEPVHAGPELISLILRALEFSELTEGAFDITYASVGRLYNYREGRKPERDELNQALTAIDYHHVKIDAANGTIEFQQPGVHIDLGGIAKGYAVDRSIAILQEAGIEHALVSAGGDTRVIGKRWGRAWKVGIRDPRNASGLVTMIPLEDSAISTSGDYERYFEADGIRYHHILNPGTGDSVRAVRSVSVIGADATTTDALSTSIFVLGVSDGIELVDSLTDIEAVIIDNQGRMHYSSGLDQVS